MHFPKIHVKPFIHYKNKGVAHFYKPRIVREAPSTSECLFYLIFHQWPDWHSEVTTLLDYM